MVDWQIILIVRMFVPHSFGNFRGLEVLLSIKLNPQLDSKKKSKNYSYLQLS